MNQQGLGSEDQLRQYADAVAPEGYVEGTRRVVSNRRGPNIRTTWLMAAAALLVLLGVLAIAQREPAQVITTGDFVQQPEQPSEDDQPSQPPTGSLPLPSDVPATGDLRTREDALVVMMAQFVLVGECMTAQGFDYPMPTDQEWVELFGGWRASGILGIGSEGAARLIGYQNDGWGGAGSPTQAASSRNLNTDAILDCWPGVYEALGDYQNQQIYFHDALNIGSDGTQGERFRSDPALAAAITTWQGCVRTATGIEADTPNTLARAFVHGSLVGDDREREVAVADVRCQDASNLEEAFYLARTKQVRLELGADATVFDDWARFRIESTRLAQQVLDERGIVPPSLD